MAAHSLGLGVDFTKGGKQENPEKTPRSTGEANYNNSTHMSSTLFERSRIVDHVCVATVFARNDRRIALLIDDVSVDVCLHLLNS